MSSAPPIPFIRTVQGDLPASNSLGACDAHEHLAMSSRWIEDNYPHLFRGESRLPIPDFEAFRTAGGGWVVDCTPPGSGRDARILAAASLASGLAVVASTGRHLPRYYPAGSNLLRKDREELTRCFVNELESGMDDGAGPTPHLAGVIKIASEGGDLSDDERELFAAAAAAQVQTGSPIITHTAAGPECAQQVALLLEQGALPEKVVLSHCDKNPDVEFHRNLLQAGVCLEYDQHFRHLRHWRRCATLDLVAELIEEHPHQIVLGMDLARNAYWSAFGGSPGLAWLLTELPGLLRNRGVTQDAIERMTTHNAVRAFSFSSKSNNKKEAAWTKDRCEQPS